MQTVGVLLLTAAVWLIYCGVTGIPPWTTIQAIIKNPDQASEIIGQAKKAVEDANQAVLAANPIGATLGLGSGSPYINPWIGYKVSDGYLARGGQHKGIDYEMPVGTALVAAGSGVVHNTTSGGTGGWITSIRLDNGYTLLYMHLSKQLPSLEGKRVKYGAIIGYSGGAAGAAGAGDSTGPHLHFQVNDPGGNPIDPAKYFAGIAGSGTPDPKQQAAKDALGNLGAPGMRP